MLIFKLAIWHPIFTPLPRFRLHFEKESKEEVEKRKKMAREKVLQPVSDKELEININDIYPTDKGLVVFERLQRLSFK